jgi:hypothetical protein
VAASPIWAADGRWRLVAAASTTTQWSPHTGVDYFAELIQFVLLPG